MVGGLEKNVLMEIKAIDWFSISLQPGSTDEALWALGSRCFRGTCLCGKGNIIFYQLALLFFFITILVLLYFFKTRLVYEFSVRKLSLRPKSRHMFTDNEKVSVYFSIVLSKALALKEKGTSKFQIPGPNHRTDL